MYSWLGRQAGTQLMGWTQREEREREREREVTQDAGQTETLIWKPHQPPVPVTWREDISTDFYLSLWVVSGITCEMWLTLGKVSRLLTQSCWVLLLHLTFFLLPGSHIGKHGQTIYCLQHTIRLSGPNTVNNPNTTNLLPGCFLQEIRVKNVPTLK